jgi:uncharacterized Zn finger protein
MVACQECGGEATPHMIIRKDTLKEGGEVALLVECNICKGKLWLVDNIPKGMYYPFDLDVGDSL